METFFQKLGKSPWEEKFASFCGMLLKLIFTLAIIGSLVKINVLIEIFRGIPS